MPLGAVTNNSRLFTCVRAALSVASLSDHARVSLSSVASDGTATVVSWQTPGVAQESPWIRAPSKMFPVDIWDDADWASMAPKPCL